MQDRLARFEASIWRETAKFLGEPRRPGLRRWLGTGSGKVYLRISQRFLDAGRPVCTLEIGAVEIAEKLRGQGWLKRYLAALGECPLTPGTIILECVNEPRMLEHAERNWRPLPNTPQTFFLSKSELSAKYASANP